MGQCFVDATLDAGGLSGSRQNGQLFGNFQFLHCDPGDRRGSSHRFHSQFPPSYSANVGQFSACHHPHQGYFLTVGRPVGTAREAIQEKTLHRRFMTAAKFLRIFLLLLVIVQLRTLLASQDSERATAGGTPPAIRKIEPPQLVGGFHS
jgi:hypothetical protein